MLKAVLMDIDDTLLDFGKCAEQAMRIGFAEWGLPYDDSTYATFTRINDGLWLMIERGELTTQQLFEFRWNRIFEALGIQADGAAFEKRFLDLLYETAIPVDGADEICRYLKGKYILCAASNAFHDQQLNRLEMAGLLPYFDHVFVSESLGYRKPEKAFFDACRAFLPDVAADECVMIGDSLTADIAGGKNTGIDTCWYNPSGKTVEPALAADYEIRRLDELPPILEGE